MQIKDALPIIATLIVAIIAAVPGILAFVRQLRSDIAEEGIKKDELEEEKRRRDIEAAGVLTSAVSTMINPLSQRLAHAEAKIVEQEKILSKQSAEIGVMQKQISRLRHVNSVLCKGIRTLINQLQSNEIEPLFQIDKSLCEEVEDWGNTI